MKIDKFVEENKRIVKMLDGVENYNPDIKEITYTGKIGNEENIKTLYDVIQNKNYKKILLVSPTASGKTFAANELMKKLNEIGTDCGIFCPNRVQNEQNSGSQYRMKKVVGGVKLDETDVEDKLRISAVYDKADEVLDELWRRAQHGAKSPVFFIDEAHTLIEQLFFRENAINAVTEIINDVTDIHNGTIVFITATPEKLLSMRFDLIVNCNTENYIPVSKKLTILETDNGDNFHKVMLEQIVKLFRGGKIPFVRLNSKPMISTLQRELAAEGIVTESVTGDDKTYDYDKITNEITYHNNIYDAVVNNSQLPGKNRDGKKIDCYLCTSVLECGTNILNVDSVENKNLVPFFIIADSQNASADAVEQFFNRVRYQVDDCYLLIPNENYNNLVNIAIDGIGNLENVKIKSNISNTYFEVIAETSIAYRKICAICNEHNVFCITKNANEETGDYRVDICKKSLVELEQIVSDQISKNKTNFEILNSIFNGITETHGADYSKTKIDEILKQPTTTGVTNSLNIVKRDRNSLVIDINALWKYAHDQYCKQYFFLRDIFYAELKNRLGITNISVEKAESLNINMKEIKDKVRIQTLEIIKNEIDKNENLLQEILEDKNVENLKEIVKTVEYKSFMKFVKLNNDITTAFNTVRDFNKSKLDKLYNEKLKEKLSMFNRQEKDTLEKLAKMDKLDYSIIKNEESVEIIRIIIESTYWKLFVDAIKAGISADLLITQIMKQGKVIADIKVYIQSTVVVNVLKSVNFDYERLGNTIIEKEIKVALKMFYEEKLNGEMKEKAIKSEDLIKLQNKLNTELRSVSSTYYKKEDAKFLLQCIFHMRPEKKEKETDKKKKKSDDKNIIFTIRSVARSAL